MVNPFLDHLQWLKDIKTQLTWQSDLLILEFQVDQLKHQNIDGRPPNVDNANQTNVFQLIESMYTLADQDKRIQRHNLSICNNLCKH
jgi:hypothetical protein